MSPLSSQESPNKETKLEVASSPVPSQGAQKRVAFLRNPGILGDSRTRGQKQKWLHHPCLLMGPKEGGIAM